MLSYVASESEDSIPICKLADLTCVGLDTVTTTPRAQRRGAASLLLQWGIERAVKDRLPVLLYAEPQGYALYKRLGFVDIEGQTISIPLKEYGGNGEWVIVPMVKEP
jgi:GNAT superfamily N-acetyltransferase